MITLLRNGLQSIFKSTGSGTVSDPYVPQVGIDSANVNSETNAVKVVDYEHHEIHSGSHYFHVDVRDLSINEVYDIRITVPDTTKWAHFTFRLESESETLWYLYEDVAISTVGTTEVLYNNNRNSANTSGLAVDEILNTSLSNANADTDLTGASTLLTGIIGAGRVGGADARNKEIILQQNTIYCIRTVASAAGYVDYTLEWYEHTNK